MTLLVVTAGQPAEAAFPGSNGLIAYVSDGKPAFVNDDIYVTNGNGTSDLRVRLTTHPGLDRQPAVSPNGKQVAFWSNRSGNSEIYVMDAADEDGDGNGDDLRQLTNNPANDFAPAWSPGGKRIVFTSNRDGNNEIYTVDAGVCDAGVDPAPDCPDPELTRLTTNPASDQFAVYSSDGTKLAFQTGRDGNQEIYTLGLEDDPATGEINEEGALVNLTSNPALDSLPEWSPDGGRLTFTSIRDGTDRDIWVMNRDGSSQTNLTPDRVSRPKTSGPPGHRTARGSCSGQVSASRFLQAPGSLWAPMPRSTRCPPRAGPRST